MFESISMDEMDEHDRNKKTEYACNIIIDFN